MLDLFQGLSVILLVLLVAIALPVPLASGEWPLWAQRSRTCSVRYKISTSGVIWRSPPCYEWHSIGTPGYQNGYRTVIKTFKKFKSLLFWRQMATEIIPFDEPQVVAVLKPSNVAAKVAFHQVAEASFGQNHNYTHFMHIGNQQEYDADVASVLLRPQGDCDESSTDPDSSVEEFRAATMKFWTGHYEFDLLKPPVNGKFGWVAGKKPSRNLKDGAPTDLILSLSSSSESAVRSLHASFNYNVTTGFLCVKRISGLADVNVDGHSVTTAFLTLNRGRARILIGSLLYDFEYAKFAYSVRYLAARSSYFEHHLGTNKRPLARLKTPNKDMTMSIGSWTIHGSLVSSSFGGDFIATNFRSQVVTLRNIVRKGATQAHHVASDIKKLQDLTELAEKADDVGRLLRLVDVIYQFESLIFKSGPFDDVWLALEPFVEQTFLHLKRKSIS